MDLKWNVISWGKNMWKKKIEIKIKIEKGMKIVF